MNQSVAMIESPMRVAIRWGLYPMLWLWVAGCIAVAADRPDAIQTVQMAKGGVMVCVLLLAEWLVPYEARWGMTWQFLLRRDLPFIVVNGATIGLLSWGFAQVALWFAINVPNTALMQGQPVAVQVVLALVTFEALQYSVHRVMHESRGPVTNWLWRTHAIHHLPQQLYLVMHAVFHPFNAVIVRLFVQLLPLWLLGFDPFAVFVSSSVIAFHGTVSHLNVDLRLGLFNYLFIGPELHRYHHSASSHEAMNYGATLSMFDLAFGTFRYRPGAPPAALGLREADGYPAQVAPIDALRFPLTVDPVTPHASG